MTLAEIKTLLEGITGYSNKVAYYAFETIPALPFICYFETESNDFFADGKNFLRSSKVSIELYTKTKSQTDEALVETALTNAGLTFSKDCEYLTDEKCWFTLYNIEV